MFHVKPEQRERLRHYVKCVQNGPNGLFSRGDLDRLEAHAEDGASGADLIEQLNASTIVDVGAGGGVPGIPLALMIPELRVHLVESQRWKCEFLAECAGALEISDRVFAHPLRAEEAPSELGRETLDLGIARALAKPAVVAEYLSPLIRVGGHIMLWTTYEQLESFPIPDIALEKLGLGALRIEPSKTPLRDQACFGVYEKASPCATNIPRRVGVAVRKPLK